MKKLWLALLGVGLFATAVFADNDTPVQVVQLPNAAQQFIKKHFSDVQVSYAKMGGGVMKDYEVVFVNGSKIEFNGKGDWMEVDTPRGVVPEEIVPKQIKAYVDKNYPGMKIVEIERMGRGYAVALNNGLDLKFNRKFMLIDLDD